MTGFLIDDWFEDYNYILAYKNTCNWTYQHSSRHKQISLQRKRMWIFK